MLFIEEMDCRLKCSCHHCNTQLSGLQFLKNINIETVKGNCVKFTKLINYIESKDATVGQFHKSELVYMFDYDSPLENMYTFDCNELYCKCCMSFLGWSHKNEFIILKKKFC